jgi:hypothetical protein
MASSEINNVVPSKINNVVPSEINNVVPSPIISQRTVIFELTALEPVETLEVDYSIAKHIGIIKELAPETDEFPFKVPILTCKHKYIDWICRFIEFYISRIDDGQIMGDITRTFVVIGSILDSLMAELDITEKCELLMEANELCIPVIEEALAMFIGKYIRDLPSDVREDTFTKSRELTSDEIKALRQENQWMESNDIGDRKRVKRGSIFTGRPPRRSPKSLMDCKLCDGLIKLSFRMFALVLKMI